MKKLMALLLSVTLACSFMVGCGDEDDSSSKKGNKDDSSVSAVDESGNENEDSKEDASSADDSEKPDESKADESKEDESKPDAPSAESSSFEGKWECEAMTMGGVTLEGEFFGVPVATMMQIELKSGGKGSHCEYDTEGNAEEYDITWTADGNTLTLEREGDEIEFELKDGKLVATYKEEGQSVSVTLKKVDKFTEYTSGSDAPAFDDVEPDDVTEAELVGKWECESVVMGGITIQDNLFGIPVAIMMQLDIQQGGKGVEYENEGGESSEFKFTWKLEDRICKLDFDGELIEFKMKDGKLMGAITEDGQTVSFTLKKVDKFTEFSEEDADKLLGSLLGGEE